ncbi:Hypothetical predicted protein [Octopus vulgaris]|uniref:Uncharacterized protein n=1 Tax=Octopus vulgaris TaxID=6645 RepID=A0AA36F085_OCTVU|nr:Hypothetical predicted protein [Octopus vulgaris]
MKSHDYIQSDIPLPTDKNDESILPFFPSSISSYASNIHIDAEAASKIADLTRTLTNRNTTGEENGYES